LEEPKYSIEQISAKTGKSPVYVASRLKLTELTQNVMDAFYREEIGVGHALLLTKLQPTSRNRRLPLASKRIGAQVGRSRNASCFPSAAYNSGLSRTSFLS
jgi:ParB family chromosome partitioning protein